MKCVICNQAETVPGMTSVLLERGQMRLTVNNVPARICPDCGEAYADETVTASLLREAEKMVKAGIKVDVREYEIGKT
ncbi:MAG: type II toxin-antitoxin system MqsA family antitoxin [Chloroflexi bacterium]|nr:type II toxin-antitoxin system MqsA family antitoxin [Chloroflexota bacterium]